MADLAPGPPAVLASGIVFPVLCTITVGLRLYGGKFQGRGFATDDWLLLPALAIMWVLAALLIRGVMTKALAYPRPPPGPGETESSEYNVTIVTARQTWWIFLMLQIPLLTFIKLSFVFFYRRLFGSSSGKKPFNIASYTTIVLLILWAVAFEISQLLNCGSEVSAYWNSQGYAGKHCPHILAWNNAFATSDAVLDWVVYLLPLRQVYMLHLSTARKIALVGIFSLGALTLAASLTRMVVQIKVSFVDFQGGHDNDLIITSSIYWSMIESGLALIAVCLPPIHGMIKLKLRKPLTSSTGAGGGRSNASGATGRGGKGGRPFSYGTRRTTRYDWSDVSRQGTITKTTTILQERRSASTDELRLAGNSANAIELHGVSETLPRIWSESSDTSV